MADWSPRRIAFFIVFAMLHLFLFAYGWHSQMTDKELDNLNVLRFSVWVSRGAGLVLALDCACILIPLCRNLVRFLRPTLLNKILPMDENIFLHKMIAYAMVVFTATHVMAHYVNFWTLEKANLLNSFDLHYKTWAGTTGHLMLLIMLLMYTTAAQKVRHQCFEAFWYTHHLGLLFIFMVLMHGYGCFVKSRFDLCKGYMSWRYVIVGYYFYLIERLLREYKARQETYISKVVCHPADTIEIQFKMPSFKYIAGQYLFLNVPEVSPYQWHPFTITSSPYEDFVSVHIRQVGDFTKALGRRLGCNSYGLGTNEIMLPRLRIDGPFGAPAEDVFKNEIAVLVGTGIGVTPFASILKTIFYKMQRKETEKLRRVEFFWICRDKQSFEWFQDLLKELEDSPVFRNYLRIHIYLTGRLSMSEVENIVVNDGSQAFDPVTELQSKCNYGRPSFPAIFAQMRTAIMDGAYMPGINHSKVNVGVFYCGPNVFAKTLREACKKAKTNEVNFIFSKEHF